MKHKTLVVFAVLAILIVGFTSQLILVNAGQFDSCDGLSNSYGAWSISDGGSGSNPLIAVDNSDFVEGTASIAVATALNGWTLWIVKKPQYPVVWDFTQNAMLNFKLKASYVDAPIYFAVTTQTGATEWETYRYPAFTGLVVDTWTTVNVDLFVPLSGTPDLTLIRQIAIMVNDSPATTGIPALTVHLDDFQASPSGTLQPLTASISPATATIPVGESQTFTVSVSGGSSPYTYQWYDEITALTGETSSSLTVSPTVADTYKYSVEVTDSALASVQSTEATLFVSTSGSPTSYTLDITSDGNGSVTPSGSIDYPTGEVVTITAMPDIGYQFSKWIIDGDDMLENPTAVTMNTNHVVTAYFIGEDETAPDPVTPTQPPQPLVIGELYSSPFFIVLILGAVGVGIVLVVRRRR